MLGNLLESFGESLENYRETKRTRSETAQDFNQIGENYFRIGKYDQALDYYQQALEIYKEIGDSIGEQNTVNNIAEVLNNSLFDETRTTEIKDEQGANTCPPVFLKIPPRLRPAGRRAREIQGLDQFSQSLICYLQALENYLETGTDSEVANTRKQIGLVYASLGNYREALKYYWEAFAEFQHLNDTKNQGVVLNNIGEVHRNTGRYHEALEYYQIALQLFRNPTDFFSEATTLNNLGLLHHEIGDYYTAFKLYQQALEIRKTIKDLPGQATTLHNLGFIYEQLNQHDLAFTFYQQSLELGTEHSNPIENAITLNNLGLLYNTLGNPDQAEKSLKEALETFREFGNVPNEANTLDSLGTVHKTMGDYAKALDFYQQALGIFTKIGNLPSQSVVLTNMGVLYQKQGEIKEAIAYYQQAIDEVIETTLVDLKGEKLKSSFASKNIKTYERLINLLWDAGRYQEAFDYVERAKARVFLNQIANEPITFRQGADLEMLKQEQELRIKINGLQKKLFTLSSSTRNQNNVEAISTTKLELKELKEQYINLLEKLKLQNPEAASLVSVNPLPLSEIQQRLDGDTTLVEYFVTEERTLAFVVTKNSLTPVTLPMTEASLQKSLGALYEYDFATLQNPKSSSFNQLYQQLIEPLKSHPSTSKLVIVPHHRLHYVPFAALTDGDKYLIDDYIISTLPSASVMGFLQEKRKPNNEKMLALGNPTLDLPFAQQEVESISNLYDSQTFLGVKATESAVWSQANQASILHLATHAQYNSISPLFSSLSFVEGEGYDGRLEVHELYGLDLTAATNLVVLSACQTQIGELSRGDELVGLNRAFLYAGTPSVIASLWNVDDEATGLLMERFYSYLQSGESKAKALQLAQQDTKKEFAHPYYWSGFVLTGDGGKID